MHRGMIRWSDDQRIRGSEDQRMISFSFFPLQNMLFEKKNIFLSPHKKQLKNIEKNGQNTEIEMEIEIEISFSNDDFDCRFIRIRCPCSIILDSNSIILDSKTWQKHGKYNFVPWQAILFRFSHGENMEKHGQIRTIRKSDEIWTKIRKIMDKHIDKIMAISRKSATKMGQ